jgi:hypothetical protein
MDDILRSEAHFAAVLYAELRQKSPCRDALLREIEMVSGKALGDYEVTYVEPAPFRDAWKAMSDPERSVFLQKLAKRIVGGVDIGSLEKRDAKGKIKSPASWSFSEISDVPEKLRKLYWIFRARPDLLLLTKNAAVWIELKVFSCEPSKRPDGYWQYETQLDIADLSAIAVPRLDKNNKINLIIQRKSPTAKNFAKKNNGNYIMWETIAIPTSVFPGSLFKAAVRPSNKKGPLLPV